MKYTDRKTAPLKWNTVLKLGLPVLIAYDAFSLINSLKELTAGGGTMEIKLRTIGLSLQNMGDLFWPFSLGLIESVILLVLLIYACIGLWKWEKYGIRSFLLAISLCFVDSIFTEILMNTMPLYMKFLLVGTNQYSDIAKNVLIATWIISAMIYFIIFALNFVYYRKRELLFDSYYVQPQSSEIQKPVHQNTEVFQPYYCPDCGAKIEEKDAHFCPNCGRKL